MSALLFNQLTHRAERDLPAMFVVTRRGFTARPAVTGQSGHALVLMLFIGHLAIDQWYSGVRDLAFPAVLTLMPALAFFLRRPQVVLTKDGLVLQKFLEKKARAGWDEMLAWAGRAPSEGRRVAGAAPGQAPAGVTRARARGRPGLPRVRHQSVHQRTSGTGRHRRRGRAGRADGGLAGQKSVS